MPKKKVSKTKEITPEEFVDNLELDFENVEKEDENKKEAPETADSVMRYGCEEWSKFVLGLFTDKELLDGKYPKCSALRRVGLMLGDILYSGPEQVFAGTNGEIAPRTTVVYKIELNWKWGLPVIVSQGHMFDGFNDVRTFSAVADCDHENAETQFAKHSAAMAETRAEARCWRKILLLDRVSAEEMQSPDNDDDIQKKYSKVTDNVTDDRSKPTKIQFNLINKLSEKVGVDLTKRIKHPIKIKDGSEEISETFKTIEDLDRGYAAGLISELNGYVSGIEVPDDFSVKE